MLAEALERWIKELKSAKTRQTEHEESQEMNGQGSEPQRGLKVSGKRQASELTMLQPGVSVLAAYHATSSELTRLTRSHSRKLLDGLLEFADLHVRCVASGEFASAQGSKFPRQRHVSSGQHFCSLRCTAIFRVPRLFNRAVANYKQHSVNLLTSCLQVTRLLKARYRALRDNFLTRGGC